MRRKRWVSALIILMCLGLLGMPLPVAATALPGSPGQANPASPSGNTNANPLVDAPPGPDVPVPNAILLQNAGFPPAPPASPSPADGENSTIIDVAHNNTVHLQAYVSDPDTSSLAVSFYGRPYCPNPPFTLAVLPDTQYYSQNNNNELQVFDSQTQWIVDNRTPWNIVYTTHLGDLVETWNDTTQWANANEAITRMETGLMPFGLSLGNHDMSGATLHDDSTYFNNTFPYTRFEGRSYYGGHYGTNNDNNYGLFSSGGLDFIIIDIEWNNNPDGTPTAVLQWAHDLLALQYPSRRGIIVFHGLLNETDSSRLSSDAQIIYNYLKDRPNLFLMLGGHTDDEAYLTLSNNTYTVYAIQSDYQGQPNGGNGWMRLMKFLPSANQIQVYTYSPYTGGFWIDEANQFNLTYPMGGQACDTYALIETVTGVASGSSPQIDWTYRNTNTSYEWYVTVSDGTHTLSGPRWSFHTQAPSAVGLVGLSAALTTTGVQLDWSTAQEIDLLGFNVYRANSINGLRTLLNSNLIPALNPGQLQGNSYQFTDRTGQTGRAYYYWVEWVGMASSELAGPISAARLTYLVWLPLGAK